ncbi:2-Hydroxyacid oxidase 1-like isoform X1 [Dermacentor andersoni]|uniref:2-Hydroxyacid oxidase 1-like isoform X1 n=1 Tax=Dermacentor andersoni TaxID=34620 RepID=UPI0024160D22|nr:2-Hydroxyacid oxidase 1-like isoform X1 [Dermacentor andersoni]
MILSPMSNTSLEDVDSAAPGGLRWMQTFIFKERDVTRSLVLRAEKACYKAIVVGVDWPLSGRKIYDTKCGFDISPNLTNANFEGRDFASPKTAQGNSISKLKKALIDPSAVWDDVDWLRSITKLPIVVKGIIRPEDALTAVEHGVSGIIVSNHGGRQLDGVAATIELLPDIIKAVNGRCEVYMDGGVRMGTDVTKAIAMGARAVFVSRPVVWGLAYNGQQGVAKMVSIFRDEIDRALGLLGRYEPCIRLRLGHACALLPYDVAIEVRGHTGSAHSDEAVSIRRSLCLQYIRARTTFTSAPNIGMHATLRQV